MQTKTDILHFAGKYGLVFFGLLLTVYVLAELTPKIAKFIDSKTKKIPTVIRDEKCNMVKGIYDASESSDAQDIKSDDNNNINGNEEK